MKDLPFKVCPKDKATFSDHFILVTGDGGVAKWENKVTSVEQIFNFNFSFNF